MLYDNFLAIFLLSFSPELCTPLKRKGNLKSKQRGNSPPGGTGTTKLEHKQMHCTGIMEPRNYLSAILGHEGGVSKTLDSFRNMSLLF